MPGPTLREVAAGPVPAPDDPLWGRVTSALGQANPLPPSLQPAHAMLLFRQAMQPGAGGCKPAIEAFFMHRPTMACLPDLADTLRAAGLPQVADLADRAQALCTGSDADVPGQARHRANADGSTGWHEMAALGASVDIGALDPAAWGFLQTCLDTLGNGARAIVVPDEADVAGKPALGG